MLTLSSESTVTDELREHFSKHGEIESINVKTDPTTGRSRGFAFIVFSTPEAVDSVIEAGDHVINGKKVGNGVNFIKYRSYVNMLHTDETLDSTG